MAEISGSITPGDLNPQNLMAKALYDNKAETPDELAFRKGDILTVIEQNIKGDEGWWRCSLHGRQGIVPGNRLQLFTGSQYDVPSLYPSHCSVLRRSSQQNIYQTPTKQHQSSPSSSIPGPGDNIYQVPLRPQSYGQHYQVPASSIEYCWDTQAPPRQVFSLPRMGQTFSLNSVSRHYSDAYDILPSRVHSVQGNQMSGSPATARKYSMFQTEGERRLIQQMYDIPLSFERPRSAIQSQAYDVLPRASLDRAASTYDIPAPVGTELPGRNSLPAPRRPARDGQDEWRVQRPALYNVPVCRDEAASYRDCSHSPWPGPRQTLYDIPPVRLPAAPSPHAKSADIYDVPVNFPKPAPQAIYDLPRVSLQGRESPAGASPIYDVPPQISRDTPNVQDSATSQHPATITPATPQRPAAPLATPQRPAAPLATPQHPATPLATPQRPAAPLATPQRPAAPLAMPQHPAAPLATPQRPATAVPPASPQGPDPPPAQEIRLGAEAAAATLGRLQEQVSSAVSSIMVFVSSRWREREHLQLHLEQVGAAAGHVVSSLGAFLGFVRGVKVNAGRLSDANLQGRLRNQLQVVEDSQQVLQESSRALAGSGGWDLDLLALSKPQATPDHLDRFVMVTRTVPDDVKRLVSIIIANGRLLFPQKQEEQCPQGTGEVQPRPLRKTSLGVIKHKAPVPTPPRKEQTAKPIPPTRTKECDYVQLQRKEEFERQEKEKESSRQRESFKQKKLLLERQMSEVKIRKPGDVSVKVSPEVIQSPAYSPELCKTYFNALQKAIVSFTDIINGNPPVDTLIKHSKVVIVIGQKLVDTLCQEPGQKNIHKEVLSRSNQFCGRMKKLAMATKNAVVQPNLTTMQELKEQVAELRQQAEQLRLLLEKSAA